MGGALFLYDDYSKPVSDVDMNGLYAMGGAGTVFGASLVLWAFWMFWKRARGGAGGQLQLAEGPLQKVHVDGRGGMPSRWIYRIGNLSFDVSSKAWELVTHGAWYRVYHLNGELLSIEPR